MKDKTHKKQKIKMPACFGRVNPPTLRWHPVVFASLRALGGWGNYMDFESNI